MSFSFPPLGFRAARPSDKADACSARNTMTEPWMAGDLVLTRSALDAVEADARPGYAEGEESRGYLRGPGGRYPLRRGGADGQPREQACLLLRRGLTGPSYSATSKPQP